MAKTSPLVLHLATTPEANDLLARDPFALLAGMLLDQQVPMDWAFTAPHILLERLGGDRLDPADIARTDPDKFVSLAKGPPAIHRYPGSMAGRLQKLAQHIVDEYGGDTLSIWTGVSDGAELLKRLKALPGFGVQKAKIFVALLGKQFAVRPKGWREAAGDFGAAGSYKSIADIRDTASLEKVRAFKKQMKADAKAKAAAAS